MAIIKNTGGPQGPQGVTGSVSAASGLILDESAAPSTGVDQIAIFADTADSLLKQRAESDGAVTEIGSGSGAGDMTKAVYDTGDNGIVDAAESVDGVSGAGNDQYYGTNSSGTPGFYSLPVDTTLGIQDNGVAQTVRSNLNFIGATVADNAGNDSTDVTISGGGSGHTIQDEGTPLTQRTNLNFIGSGVTATDNAGSDSTDITISSGGGGSIIRQEATPAADLNALWYKPSTGQTFIYDNDNTIWIQL